MKTMQSRLILILLIFLVLSIVGFVFTIYTLSSQMDDGMIINLAGNQRMLTQKMSKESLALSLGIGSKESLEKTINLFDRILKGLILGDNELGLPPIQNTGIASQLNHVQKQWKDFQANLDVVLRNSTETTAAITYVNDNNMKLLKEMSKAVDMLEKNAFDSKTVKLAGKQRMLTQKIVKDTLGLVLGRTSSNTLKETASLFDKVLKGLISSNSDLELNAVIDSAILAQLLSVQALWKDFNENVDTVLRLVPETNKALLYIDRHNVELLKEMNKAVRMYEEESKGKVTKNTRIDIFVEVMVLIIIMFAWFTIIRPYIISLNMVVARVEEIAQGDLEKELKIDRSDEIGKLANAIQRMTRMLRDVSAENEKQNWLKTGQNELNNRMRGDLDILTLAKQVITYLAKYLDVQVGALYIADKNNGLKLFGSYAFTKRKALSNMVKIGEGLVGQAALEKEMISVTDIPEGSVRISSATVDAAPYNIVVTPFVHQGELLGVIELGSFKEFSDRSLEFLNMVMENIAITTNSANARTTMKELLEETQTQSEELQSQSEELKASNEELVTQQEALRVINEELEEKTHFLEEQKSNIEQKSKELEKSRKDIEEKAKDLAVASKYKSEFLANMSHELRSPLNSLMLLASKLKNNKEGNLTEKQVSSAQIIYDSGNSLTSLIDDILDLSKIEAGRMDIEIRKVSTRDLSDNIITNFQHLAKEKDLEFSVELDKSVPVAILTDQKKLEQVIRNLLSNAIKFTQKGSIKIDIALPSKDYSSFSGELDHKNAIAISVTDTGIGISGGMQKTIFEAFQQADGSTARNFGGTGLGLSISKELSRLLGGEIKLRSELGKGSTFTFYVPTEYQFDSASETHEEQSEVLFYQPVLDKIKVVVPSIPDDREGLKKDDKIILVIEDDPNFAKTLLDQCRERGFKGIVTADGESGVKMALDYMPDAIILDLKLPGISGWVVLNMIKENHEIRHIPVHIVSCEDFTIEAFKKGALGFLNKPVTKEQLEEVFQKFEEFLGKKLKDLLVVEDDKNLRRSIVQLVGNGDIKISEASNGKEALKEIESGKYDCVVLDLGLPDMSGIEILKKLEAKKDFVIPPIIIYTGKELTKEEDHSLRKYSESIIIKGVKSEERLLDETALFLHRTVKKLPMKKKTMILNLHDRDLMFKDKKVLLVDDDTKNLFALAGLLDEKGITVLEAQDGANAISLLNKRPDVDLVLMDIMMPGMDGYETIRKIREIKQLAQLPIIALTAKAMKDDRGKCIAAGANDYITKPVDMNRLFSMMRVWLYQ